MSRARILADYVSSGVTAAEFDYMDGVTSNVQTQIDSAIATVSRAFYDESDAASESINMNTTLGGTTNYWSELTLSITGTNSTSDYLQVLMTIPAFYNVGNHLAYIKVGLRWSADWSVTSATFGSSAHYDRIGFISGTSLGITDSGFFSIRANHPTTSTYEIRPLIYVQYPESGGGSSINILESNMRATISGFEVKG